MSALVILLAEVGSLNICAGCSIFHHNYKYCLFNCNNIIGPRREKSCLRGFANNKYADQPAHPRRLISAFVIRFLESSISKLATSENSVFLLVSVAGVTGLIFALSKTPKTGFVASRPIYDAVMKVYIWLSTFKVANHVVSMIGFTDFLNQLNLS